MISLSPKKNDADFVQIAHAAAAEKEESERGEGIDCLRGSLESRCLQFSNNTEIFLDKIINLSPEKYIFLLDNIATF